MANRSKDNLASGIKTCSRCGIEKQLSEFWLRSAVIDGRLSWCKSCASAWQTVYSPKHYQKNKSRKLRAAKSYYAKNKRKVKFQHLFNKYGITQSQYEELLKRQNFCCRICRRPLDKGGSTCVDHCHSTGYVRAILCGNCNLAIGQMRHSSAIAISAAEYLSKDDLFNPQ